MPHAHPTLEKRGYRGASVMALTDRTFPIVHFTFALRFGALADDAEARGALAMLLPLLLRGSTTRSRRDFNRALEVLGSSIDTSVGHELAYFTGICLKQHLPATLALLQEAICQPQLSAQELAPLCEETCQALVSERDDDDSVADLFLRRLLYAGQPLAQPAVGTIDSLQKLDPAAMRRALKAICASWSVIAFAGDIDLAEALPLVQPILDAIDHPPPQAPAAPAFTEAKALRILLVDKPDRTQVQLRVAAKGVHCADADIDAFWLGTVAFGGTFTSPLTHQVRDIRGWSYVAQADFRRRSVFTSPLVLRTAPAVGDAVACLRLELQLLADIQQGRLEDAHILRARDYLIGRVPFSAASAFDLLGPAVMLEILALPAEMLWDTAQRLEAIDLASVAGVMAKHLSTQKLCAVLVGPKEDLLPKLQQEFADVQIEVVAYTDGLPAEETLG